MELYVMCIVGIVVVYLVCCVELVVHESCDNTGFAN